MAAGRRGRRRWLSGATALVLLGTGAVAAQQPAQAAAAARPWLDTSLPLERRVQLLLDALTLDEAARLLYGVKPPQAGSAGHVPGVPRLDVPPLVLSDGPAGLKDTWTTPEPDRRPATGLPAPVALAASFDPGLARSVGTLLGTEARARGVHVLYAPGVNLARVPVGGRNFEYFGEDPYLASEIAVPYVQGVQSQRVAAQVKHFALNEQEDGRHEISSNADLRTMHELYLRPFQAAVQRGGAWSVMCGNNPVNGTYACEDRSLLTGVLRDQWRFDGVVGSDYSATHSAVASITAGLDQSFSFRDWGAHYEDLPALVRAGTVPRAAVMASARRVLRLVFRVGLLDPPRAVPPLDLAAHAAVARRVAAEGTVLLRNDARLLPLDASALGSVAVVGPYALTAHPGGGGSSKVQPYRTVSPVQGLQSRLGAAVRVSGDDGSDPARAAALARGADVAVVVVGDVAREGADRPSLALPDGQDALIAAVAAANPRTVVVLQTGGPVTMPWSGQVSTVLETWYPGQEGGAALAQVLVGDVDPSGRLPVTFPRSLAQSPSTGTPRYPAGPQGYEYTEKLLMGYRGFDGLDLRPLFAFGHGLSYASAAYRDLALRSTGDGGVEVSFTAASTSRRAGVSVPQVYLGFPTSAGEPPRQLVGSARVGLSAGETERVRIQVPATAFRTWTDGGWTPTSGRFTLSVGTSSRHRPLSATVLRGAGG